MQTELSDGIAILVASNDRIQALLSQMEEVCQVTEVRHAHTHSWWDLQCVCVCVCVGCNVEVYPQENAQRQREQLDRCFAALVAILEERKQELVGLITEEQDHKLKRVRSLIRRHGDDLEAAVTLVETAIRTLEEPHMSVFVQVGGDRYLIGQF